MANTLNDVISSCVDNDVNFEVYHGTNPNGHMRACMLIELGETVRVDFGDKKHGQQISRLHLSKNHYITVTADELFAAIEANVNENVWTAQNKNATEQNIARIPASGSDYSNSNQNKAELRVRGTIEEVLPDTIIDGVTYLTYVVTHRNYYMVEHTHEAYEGQPTHVTVLTETAPADEVEAGVTQFTGDKGKFKLGVGVIFS